MSLLAIICWCVFAFSVAAFLAFVLGSCRLSGAADDRSQHFANGDTFPDPIINGRN